MVYVYNTYFNIHGLILIQENFKQIQLKPCFNYIFSLVYECTIGYIHRQIYHLKYDPEKMKGTNQFCFELICHRIHHSYSPVLD